MNNKYDFSKLSASIKNRFALTLLVVILTVSLGRNFIQAVINEHVQNASIFILLLVVALSVLSYLMILRPVLKASRQLLEDIDHLKSDLYDKQDVLKSTLHSVSVAVVVLDEQKNVASMNPIAEEITGCSESDMQGKHYKNLFYNVDIQYDQQPINPIETIYRSAGAISRMAYNGSIYQTESPVKIDGIVQAMYSPTHELRGSVITFQDVTKQATLESEMSAFLEVDLDMFFVLSVDKTLLRVNKMFLDVMKYEEHEVLNHSIEEWIYEEDHEIATRHFYYVLNDDQITISTLRMKNKEHEVRHIEWRSKKSWDFLYTSARDVTEHVLNETRLKEIAIKDELTGLYNRYFLDSFIGQELERAERYHETYSLLILDLDHFKVVNDTWGHPTGDDVLRFISEVMLKHKRSSDQLMRFGGEEFIILMPETDFQGAKIAAEHIRQAVENSVHPVSGKITISIGLAEHMQSESFRHWYKRADDALYHAKQSGRNRVVVAEELDADKSFIVQFAWQPEWESGYEILDNEHKKLHELANILVGVLYESDETEKIIHVLDSLIEFVAFHFASEERLLSDIGYVDYDIHAEAHKNLVAKVLKYKESYLQGQLKEAAFLSFIIDDILIGHLVKMDSKFFPVLQEKSYYR